jgi:hypothetical protein
MEIQFHGLKIAKIVEAIWVLEHSQSMTNAIMNHLHQ